MSLDGDELARAHEEIAILRYRLRQVQAHRQLLALQLKERGLTPVALITLDEEEAEQVLDKGLEELESLVLPTTRTAVAYKKTAVADPFFEELGY